MIPRFYCPPAPHCILRPGAQLDLPEAAAHHALRVLRLQAGERVVLFDGHGGEWQAELVGKVGAGGTARVALREFIDVDNEPPLALTLVQGLPAGDKMDWVVEKCVELGVTAIQPIAAKRSVIKLSAERMLRRVAHWNAVAAAACEQCGRNRVPVVAPILDLPHYLACAKMQNEAQNEGGNAMWLMLAPAAEISLRLLDKPSGPVAVAIGPEGGWEESEVRAAQAAGFKAVQLGPRVLRTETAGVAVLAAMQSLWGDF